MMKCACFGRIGKDPEGRTMKTDQSMVTTILAVDVTAYNSEEQETLWLNVVAFGKAADELLRHQKGDLVSLFGRVTRNRWVGSDGVEHEQLSMIADAMVSARTSHPGGRRKRAALSTDDALVL